jgi:hypothetical protein
LLEPFGLFEFQRETPAHPHAAWMFILPNLTETHKAPASLHLTGEKRLPDVNYLLAGQ